MNLLNQKVLILGGGIAGLTAALALNRLGISVELLEKTGGLGRHGPEFLLQGHRYLPAVRGLSG